MLLTKLIAMNLGVITKVVRDLLSQLIYLVAKNSEVSMLNVAVVASQDGWLRPTSECREDYCGEAAVRL